MEKLEWIVVFTDFGMGDVICSTVAFRNLRKKYPEIPIIAASVYPDIYLHNPNINHVYALGQWHDLYEKWCRPAKSFEQIFNLKIYERPYQRLGTKPISAVMCDQLNVPFDNDTPEIFLTDAEDEFGKDFCLSYQKPTVLIQCESARPPLQANKKMINEKDMVGDWWERLVAAGKDKYDFIQMGCSEEKPIAGVKTSLLGKTTVRQTFSIAKYASSFVCIDSFLGHAGAAVGKSGHVLFGRSRVKTLGHESNNNIIVRESCPDIECCRPEPQFGDLMVDNNALKNWACPDRVCMKAITVPMVLEALDKQLDVPEEKDVELKAAKCL